jgi:hypothetical protein
VAYQWVPDPTGVGADFDRRVHLTQPQSFLGVGVCRCLAPATHYEMCHIMLCGRRDRRYLDASYKT